MTPKYRYFRRYNSEFRVHADGSEEGNHMRISSNDQWTPTMMSLHRMTDLAGWGGVLPTEFFPEPEVPELLHLINTLDARVRALENLQPTEQ